MNKLHLFLAIGLVILFFGCTEGKTGTDLKEIALGLARETPEGGLAYALKGSFDLTPKCTETEYKGKVAVISPFLQKYGVSLNTDASKVIEESKECDPKIKEEIEQNGNIYVVSYSFEVSPTCALEGAKDANGDHFVEIEIDPKSKNANVVKGKFDEDGADKASQVKLFLPLAGNCIAPLLLSTAYLTDTIGTAKPVVLECNEGDECIVDLSKCKESEKADAWKGKDKLEGTIVFSYYTDKSGLMCNVDGLKQAWPVVEEKGWWCGKVSCGTAAPEPGSIGAIDRKAASEIVITEIIGKMPNKNNVEAYVYPNMLKAGDIYSYADDTAKISHLKAPENGGWLFWIDKQPGAGFTHEVIIGVVNAKDGSYETYSAGLWPYLNGRLIAPAEAWKNWKAYNIFYLGQYAAFGEPIVVPTAILNLQLFYEEKFGVCGNKNSRKKAIVIYGTPNGIVTDGKIKLTAIKMYNKLCGLGYDTRWHTANTSANMLNWISNEVADIRATSQEPGRSLNNFFFYATSHGHNLTGNMGLDYSNASDLKQLRVADLAAILGPNAWDPNSMWAESHTIMQDSCHSGYATDVYRNAAAANNDGEVGWIFSATTKENVMWDDPARNRTWTFTNGVVDCMAKGIHADDLEACVQTNVDTALNPYGPAFFQNVTYAKLTDDTSNLVPVTPNQ